MPVKAAGYAIVFDTPDLVEGDIFTAQTDFGSLATLPVKVMVETPEGAAPETIGVIQSAHTDRRGVYVEIELQDTPVTRPLIRMLLTGRDYGLAVETAILVKEDDTFTKAVIIAVFVTPTPMHPDTRFRLIE